ncbi:hypothetical protein ACFU6R_24440 [Streptomyces sp. NPDC057499]|uniref:hypothetical protein n=1 Tax=Streptomyces sp. NPDC057499 TaxID=3346150 RepID=UPI0036C3101F
MSGIDNFLEILSGRQLQWFQQQPKAKQTAMAGQWLGSGATPEDIVENNGGPAPEGGRDALPDLQ